MIYRIPAGTDVLVIKEDDAFRQENLIKYTTRRDNVFFEKSVCFTPTNRSIDTGSYFRHGYYGFRDSGWILIVHESKIGLKSPLDKLSYIPYNIDNQINKGA